LDTIYHGLRLNHNEQSNLIIIIIHLNHYHLITKRYCKPHIQSTIPICPWEARGYKRNH